MKEFEGPASVGIRNDFNETERTILGDEPRFGGDKLADARIFVTVTTTVTASRDLPFGAVVDAATKALAAIDSGRIDIAREVLRALLSHLSTAPRG